jgi:tRNA nucleotidyltransferase (CCA-adding enzyme)
MMGPLYFRSHIETVVRDLCEAVRSEGGRALLVGGVVRDMLLGRCVSEIDIEAYGIGPDALRVLIERRHAVDLVGVSFGVLKLRGLPIDVALPRRESKSGLGHRAFDVLSDPGMSFEEAASRRDFTINAMLFDPLDGELIDPFGGQADLQQRVLRHTSGKFREDPLRVLRGMQFVARFRLSAAPETIAVCRCIEPEGLPRERLFDEWKKLLLRGDAISAGLDFLRATGWVRYAPELEALIDCPQDPEWHPEGDVWTHTGHSLDAFAGARVGDEWEDLIVGLAVLCHDMGKPPTTKMENSRIRTFDHEAEGEALTRSFLERLTAQQDLIDQVAALVRDHLKPTQLHEANAGAAAVRRLARRVGRIDRLVRVAEADFRGRPPKGGGAFEAGSWLLAQAEQLALAARAPRPLLLGRHLLRLGLHPSPRFAAILDACFEAQLDGAFSTEEEGLRFLRAMLSARGDTPQ